MSTEFRNRNFSFGSPGTQQGRAQFTNTVRNAAACLQGFDVSFERKDHHLKQTSAEVRNVRVEETDVTYDVVFNLIDDDAFLTADQSPDAEFFNQGNGEINVIVIADVEAR